METREEVKHLELAEKLLEEGLELVRKGDSVQASEKLYKAAEECIKAMAHRLGLEEAEEAAARGGWNDKLLDRAAKALYERVGRRIYDYWVHAYFLYVEGFHEMRLDIEQVKYYIKFIEELLNIANDIIKNNKNNNIANDIIKTKNNNVVVLLEDGSFELGAEEAKLKGLIRAVATADDVVKASSLGYSSVVAEVFLPEAVEEAKRRNIELVDIEDLAGPLADFMIKALAARRPDQLVRFFDSLAPPNVLRSYDYWEHPSYKGTLFANTFSVRFAIPNTATKLIEGLTELMAFLSSKLSASKIEASFQTENELSKNMFTITLKFSIRHD